MTALVPNLYSGDPTNLDGLLDLAAVDLAGQVAKVYDLAEWLVAIHCGPTDLDARLARRTAALVVMVEARMNKLISVDCLLDEVRQSSYNTTAMMAKILIDEITVQDYVNDALISLVGTEIAERAERHD